jgi:hypothetical protein
VFRDKAEWRKSPQQAQGGTHPDHATNLKTAEVFLKNIENSLKPGMSVRVSGDTALVMAFQAPGDALGAPTAIPVALSQDSSEFGRQIESGINAVMRTATSFWEKRKIKPGTT